MPHNNARKRPRRRPTHPLSRQAQDKPVTPPGQQARLDILLQLQDTIVACEGLFDGHGPACTCGTCCLTTNLVGSLRVFRMLLEIT
ncbi:MAG: hypothetical protein K2R98_31730 [Gemmataceae bacterium]|nr:hypothetical protein [Gemmataceae bacterium]